MSLTVLFLTFHCFIFSPPQIRIASRLNAKTVLDIDNAKLAADDFKMKCVYSLCFYAPASLCTAA